MYIRLIAFGLLLVFVYFVLVVTLNFVLDYNVNYWIATDRRLEIALSYSCNYTKENLNIEDPVFPM